MMDEAKYIVKISMVNKNSDCVSNFVYLFSQRDNSSMTCFLSSVIYLITLER